MKERYISIAVAALPDYADAAIADTDCR